MSTNATIAMQDGNTIRAIYLHWDGYPDHTGITLEQYYTTEEQVRALIDLGNLSVLQPKLNPDPDKTHDFLNSQEDVCVAYHRDRDAPLCIHEFHNANRLTEKSLYRKLHDISDSFVYLWRNGEWNISLGAEFTSLKTYLKNQTDA